MEFKKPLRVADDSVNKALELVYKDLNEIIRAVNDSSLSSSSTVGKRGDVRVSSEGFQYHDGFDWKFIVDPNKSIVKYTQTGSASDNRALNSTTGTLTQVREVLATLLKDLRRDKIIV